METFKKNKINQGMDTQCFLAACNGKTLLFKNKNTEKQCYVMDENCPIMNLQNFDVSQFIASHLSYKPKLDLLFDFVRFDS